MSIPVETWPSENEDEATDHDESIGNIGGGRSARHLSAGNRTPRKETPFSLLNFRKRKTKRLLVSGSDDFEEFLMRFDTYLNEKANVGSCTCRTGKKKSLSCDCLSILQDDICRNAVAKYILEWAQKPYQEQTQVLVDWTRYAKPSPSNKRCFLIPYVPEPAKDYSAVHDHKICVSALITMMGFSDGRWKTIKKLATTGGDSTHGLQGKAGNRKRSSESLIVRDLREHFTVLEGFAEPQATRYVREVTGEVTERDNDDKSIFLPTSMSKRYCYKRYCYDRGVAVKTNNKGVMTTEPRTDFEGEPKECIPYSSYFRFWGTEYSHLKVGKPSEDICSYCFMFANRHKYRSNKSRSLEAGEAQDNTNSPTSADGRVEVTGRSFDEPLIDAATASNDASVNEMEAELLVAERHCQMARAQRQRFQEKIQHAKSDPSVKTLVVDYGQNMQLPWFGSKQPGNTYYFTPLNAYNLGIVDVALNGVEVLYCHLYDESVGRKGGDNVASLIMKSLHSSGWLEDNTVLTLNIIFDNCPGQNKNNHVVRLVPLLVELGYFKQVEFMFLIVGHTKNNCDRWFNTLKSKYRKSNVYTMPQLIDVLGTVSPQVKVCTVNDGDFKGYNAFLNKFYRTIPSITKSHIFVWNDGDTLNTDTKRVLRVYECDPDKVVDVKSMVFSYIKQGFESRSDYPKTNAGLKEAIVNREAYIKNAYASIEYITRLD